LPLESRPAGRPTCRGHGGILDDHVASAGERGILRADEGGVDRGLRHGVFRPIDEAEQVAVVKVFEAVHFVGHRDGGAEPRDDSRRELETQIHARRADMKEKVARGGDGVMHAADFAERVQVFRFRRSPKLLPGVEPIPMTQESPPSSSRKPTPRMSEARSPHKLRTAASEAAPALMVATRKMAARVSRASTACGVVDGTPDSLAVCSGTVNANRENGAADTPNLPEGGTCAVGVTLTARLSL
jgi:hypothetical protein